MGSVEARQYSPALLRYRYSMTSGGEGKRLRKSVLYGRRRQEKRQRIGEDRSTRGADTGSSAVAYSCRYSVI